MVAENQTSEQYFEPWELSPVPALHESADKPVLVNSLGTVIVDMYGAELLEEDEATHLRRIRACVNFCAGVPTDQLERHDPTKLLDVVVEALFPAGLLLVPMVADSLDKPVVARCAKCQAEGRDRQLIAHAANCPVGKFDEIWAKLAQLRRGLALVRAGQDAAMATATAVAAQDGEVSE